MPVNMTKNELQASINNGYRRTKADKEYEDKKNGLIRFAENYANGLYGEKAKGDNKNRLQNDIKPYLLPPCNDLSLEIFKKPTLIMQFMKKNAFFEGILANPF
jgi:hypothetical protein